MKTIADMLFQYCLQNRWVKAALTVTEVMAMLVRPHFPHPHPHPNPNPNLKP